MPKYLTVSALNRYLKFKFDSDRELQSILLKAEISNFKRHSRGHLYLTLKDDQSQVSAVMFASHTNQLTFIPKDGDKIIVSGYVSIYEPYGNYQVYITEMMMDGVGDLYLAYEQLKLRLEAEGLFKQEKKKPIPLLPKTVGVITSKTGAAIKDVINVINSRFPLTKIIVYPASVQGVFAKDEIVKQIHKANQDQFVDVLIVGRGGGSIEDLWPFNEEIVARAISDSSIPIISAVGHETDFTIADFVADLRASTPSHAAELVVPHHRDVSNQINQQQYRFKKHLEHLYQQLNQRFKQIISKPIFKQPLRLIQTQEMKLAHISDRLNHQNPLSMIDQRVNHINQLNITLNQHFKHYLERLENRYVRTLESLDYVNPLSIMTKGYAIIKQNEQIKKSIKEINQLEHINIVMHDGELVCSIIDQKGKINE